MRRAFASILFLIFCAFPLMSASEENTNGSLTITDLIQHDLGPEKYSKEYITYARGQLGRAYWKPLVMCVRGRSVLDQDKIFSDPENKSPNGHLWALKVLSAKEYRLSYVAKEFMWTDFSQYFREKSLKLAQLIRGEIDTREYSDWFDSQKSRLSDIIEIGIESLNVPDDRSVADACHNISVYVISGAKEIASSNH